MGGLPAFSEASLAASVAAFQDATLGGSSTSGIPRPAPAVLYFGDVAAGPGGFSEYMLWRRGGAGKGFGFTLRDHPGSSGHDFEAHRFHHRAPPECFHACASALRSNRPRSALGGVQLGTRRAALPPC